MKFPRSQANRIVQLVVEQILGVFMEPAAQVVKQLLEVLKIWPGPNFAVSYVDEHVCLKCPRCQA